VLVSLGLTDVGGLSRPVVGRILALLPEVEVDVVVGEGAESRAALADLAARDPRVRLHVAAKDMAVLMAAADLCVGAGGSTVWERCALGLPTVMMILAGNQRAGGLALRDAGATLLAEGGAAGLDEPLTRLYRDAGLRRRVGQAGAALCDGQGAARATEACYALLA
jgi:spore coat polysaccharide biosynthesis predicted glycosyltransferase SpsG